MFSFFIHWLLAYIILITIQLAICRLQRNIVITPSRIWRTTKSTGISRALEYCSCAEAYKTNAKWKQKQSAILFSMLKCEILSILGSLNQYKHKGSFILSIWPHNLQDRNYFAVKIMQYIREMWR